MKTAKNTARASKSSATTTRKPVASAKRTAGKPVNIRRVTANAFDPPMPEDNCPPEITAEAAKLFPDLKYIIRTADGKELPGSVMDMRGEIYRIRRMKGDTLIVPVTPPAPSAQMAVVEITEANGNTKFVNATLDIAAAEKFAKGFNDDAPPTHRAIVHRIDVASAIAHRSPHAEVGDALAAWLDALSTKITGGDMPGRWLRKIATMVVQELLIGLDDAMSEAGESKDYRPDGAYNYAEHFDRLAAEKKGA
jgi:hypothetical protein